MSTAEIAKPKDAFPETRWSMVLAVREGGCATKAERALNDLCRMYWRPLYTYARRKGNTPQDAEDLTQDFMAQILKRNLFARADQEMGRLRSYLLTSFEHHIRSTYRNQNAQKRGSRQEFVSASEIELAEHELVKAEASQITPERLFDRQCALALVEAAMGLLAKEQETDGQGAQFAKLKREIEPKFNTQSGDQAALAEELGMTHDQLRSHLTRLRARFRLFVRQLVRETLHHPTENQVDEELAALREALTSPV